MTREKVTMTIALIVALFVSLCGVEAYGQMLTDGSIYVENRTGKAIQFYLRSDNGRRKKYRLDAGQGRAYHAPRRSSWFQVEFYSGTSAAHRHRELARLDFEGRYHFLWVNDHLKILRTPPR